jgi:hypothetical protein
MKNRPTTARIVFAGMLAITGLASAQTPPPGVQAQAAPGAAGMPNLIQTSIEAANRAGAVGETLSFKATLKFAQPPGSVSGHELKFLVEGTLACTGKTDASGLASCTWAIPSLAQGSHPYEVRFEGEEPAVRSLAPSGPHGPRLVASRVSQSLLVARAPATLVLVPMVDAGMTARIRADLKRSSDGKLLPPKPLSFKLNGKDATLTLEPNGTVYDYPVPAGTAGSLKFEAFYAGDDYTNAASAQLIKSFSYFNSAFPTQLSMQQPIGFSVQQGSSEVGNVTLYAVLKTQLVPGGGPWTLLPGATIKFYACKRPIVGDGSWDCTTQIGFAITNAQGVASQTVGEGVQWYTYPIVPADGTLNRKVHVQARFEGDPLHQYTVGGAEFVVNIFKVGKKSPI